MKEKVPRWVDLDYEEQGKEISGRNKGQAQGVRRCLASCRGNKTPEQSKGRAYVYD